MKSNKDITMIRGKTRGGEHVDGEREGRKESTVLDLELSGGSAGCP